MISFVYADETDARAFYKKVNNSKKPGKNCKFLARNSMRLR